MKALQLDVHEDLPVFGMGIPFPHSRSELLLRPELEVIELPSERLRLWIFNVASRGVQSWRLMPSDKGEIGVGENSLLFFHSTFFPEI